MHLENLIYITSAQAAEAFTFFLQSKKVNKKVRRLAPQLPTMVLLIRNKELDMLKQLYFFPSTLTSGSQFAEPRSDLEYTLVK